MSAGRSGRLLPAVEGAVAGIVILCDRMLPNKSSVPPPNSIFKSNVDLDDMNPGIGAEVWVSSSLSSVRFSGIVWSG